MKKSILSILLLAIVMISPLHATVRCYTTYYYSNLYFNICYNDTYISREKLVYYKAVSKLLNDYIKQKIDEGSVERYKIFDIHIGCTCMGTYPSVEMYHYKKGYYFFIREFPKLPYLVRIIDYFLSEKWSSFCYEYNDLYPNRDERILKNFNRKLRRIIPKVDLSFFKDKTILFYKVSNLKVYYQNEKVSISINGKRVNAPLGNVFPVKIRDRYIILGKKYLYVYTDKKLIKRVKIPESSKYEAWNHRYSIKVFKDWVNIYWSLKPERGSVIFSYCYSKNRFYDLSYD